jgi:putative membrane protein
MSLNQLPLVNACLNGLAGMLLIAGLILIKAGRREQHRNCMVAAFATSCVFLVLYLFHKFVVVKGVHTRFPGPPSLLPWYLAMLFSHIALAIAVVPLALVTIHRGLGERFDQHRKVARWTWPIWMYVSVTGVLVYLALYVFWPVGSATGE